MRNLAHFTSITMTKIQGQRRQNQFLVPRVSFVALPWKCLWYGRILWSGFNKHKNYHFHECVAHKVSGWNLLNQIANNNKIFEGFQLKVDDLGT